MIQDITVVMGYVLRFHFDPSSVQWVRIGQNFEELLACALGNVQMSEKVTFGHFLEEAQEYYKLHLTEQKVEKVRNENIKTCPRP